MAKKSVNDGLEITDVVLCAIEGQPRALKDISHGQVRPDERPRISKGGAAPSKHAASTA
jgi:hypothetical protein